MSYDNAVEILSYYSERQSFLYDLQYNAARVYTRKEVFIFSDDLKLPKASVLPFINNALMAGQMVIRQMEFEELEA